MRFLEIVFLIVVLTSRTECAKILGVFHMPSPSHSMACKTLMKILASKGHDVTVVAPFQNENPSKNYKEIFLPELSQQMARKGKMNLFESTENPLVQPVLFHSILMMMLENIFNHTKFQEFMDTQEKFDVVIIEQVESEALKYVAHHFNAPLIIFNPIDANEWVNVYQGNPDSPAYVPSLYLPQLSCEMSFFERVYNSLIYTYYHIYRKFFILPDHDSLLHKYFPDAPPIEQIAYNVSLVLLNADSSVQEPFPKVPSLINIGDFHITPPKPLPEDLRKILDNAKNGVIYFSLGSNLKSKDMPEEKRKIFLDTFAKLKEIVLWKFEDDQLPGKPSNVFIRKWFPQNDILAHRNVKVFITHGGIFSTMESTYHGVPIVTLPVFGDQRLNAKRAEKSGYGKYIPFKELTEDAFLENLKEILENPKYTENVKKRSKIMKDKPMSPADTLNYWVEYVVRHNGATHLRVASLKLEWYQYILLDVILFLGVSVFIVLYLLKLMFRAICSRNSKIKEKTH